MEKNGVYMFWVFGGDDYFAEATKERLAEDIRSYFFGSIPEEDCT